MGKIEFTALIDIQSESPDGRRKQFMPKRAGPVQATSLLATRKRRMELKDLGERSLQHFHPFIGEQARHVYLLIFLIIESVRSDKQTPEEQTLSDPR